MSVQVEVVHFADVGCPWDYSAEPVRIALEQRYGEQLSWRTVQVGLHESGEAMARRGYTAAGLAEAYRTFQERHGMPFCTEERPRLAGTWYAGRAVKAAELQDPVVGAALLRRLRLGWFLEARLLDERDEIIRAAGEIAALDIERFASDLDGEVSARALEADMAATRRPDRVAIALEKTAETPGDRRRYTTPTYVFLRDGRSASVPGFQPLQAYEVALHNLAPEVERRPALGAREFLLAHAGEPYATVEIASATGRSERRTKQQLAALARTHPVQRTAADAGELFSWGAPKFTLACPAPTRPELGPLRELAA